MFDFEPKLFEVPGWPVQVQTKGGIPLQKWQISHWLYFPSNEDDLSAFYIAVTVTQQKNKGKGGSQHWTASYNYQSSSSLFFLPPAFTSCSKDKST